MGSLIFKMASISCLALICGGQVASAQTCEVLTEFETDAQNRYWRTTNDNVMGGRSKGGPQFENGILTFSGAINTNGGGFSMIRARVSPGRLEEYKSIKLRAKGDGRQFRLTLEDGQGFRRMRLAHRADLPLPSRDWRDITINFDQLIPTYFGEPVKSAPFSPENARSIGFIISDKIDGPFQLNVDWIKICK